MKQADLQKFRTPGIKFRGAPFWAWNSKLEIPELLRQLRHLKRMGFGGFFMHARVGLDTEYLGDEWFECIRACVAEAEKLGMNAWLYDEDRWPSGAAGGKVTRDDRYKMKGLYCEPAADLRKVEFPENTLAWFAAAADPETRTVSSFRRIPEPERGELAAGEQLLRFYWKNDERSSWFNGETYLDTLNEEAVRKFVEVTHEQYLRKTGEQFGRTIPGIFTDEPCYSHFAYDALPWSLRVPEEFRKKYGYDLLDHLPELFYHTGEEVSHARWAYYSLITGMFVKAFAGTIGNWCGEHGLKLTGHILAEDSLTSQTACSGAAMRFYEHMQIPGIDLLTEHWDVFGATRQCVSAARQFGKPVRLTEIYGCTGWDFSFAGHKALGDWQYALGINFRCQHLAWYSMSGESKRDFPASISYQSPWSEKYSQVEDYFARIGSILTGGEEIRELLVIHPLESFWSVSLRHPEVIPEKRSAMDSDFEWITRELFSENLDFDYGDEEILSRLGSAGQEQLQVGKAVYRSVLIPQLKTIRSSTLELLKQFALNGGQVCYLGTAPRCVDAVQSGWAEDVFTRCFTSVNRENFIEQLSCRSRRVSLKTPDGKEIRPLLYHFAAKEDFHSLFICNFGKEFSEDMMQEDLVRNRTMSFPEVAVSVKMPQCGKVYELDPETGNIHAVSSSYSGGAYHFRTSFEPLASRLFLITKNMPAEEILPVREEPVLRKAEILPAENWNFELEEPNVLVLDHADYSVDGKERGKSRLILHIDNDLREQLGAVLRGESMIQPWARRPEQEQKTLDLRLLWHFDCDGIPSGCRLVLENPELYQASINGKPLKLENSGWWIDKALRTVPIPAGFIQNGENVIEMRSVYSAEQPGLENIYLLGNFGVRNDRISAMPSSLAAGDWCPQGLPYYAGNLTYCFPLEKLPEGRIFVSFPSWRGSALGIRVNDGEEKMLAWYPERLEITPHLNRKGRNRLCVTVYNHRRNAFGPFYLRNCWPVWTGTRQFKNCETEERQTVPLGLLAPPVLETEI